MWRGQGRITDLGGCSGENDGGVVLWWGDGGPGNGRYGADMVGSRNRFWRDSKIEVTIWRYECVKMYSGAIINTKKKKVMVPL